MCYALPPNICRRGSCQLQVIQTHEDIFGHSLIILLIDFVTSIDNFVEPMNAVEFLKISVNENIEEHTSFI